MSENEIIHIREELADIKTSVDSQQKDLKRILFCLLGDFDKNGGCGLLAEHHERGKEFSKAQEDIEDHGKRIGLLEGWRSLLLAYAAAVSMLVVVAYFLLDHHFNLPKVNLNPTIAHEQSK